MIEIDGSQMSGSGTIVRHATAYSALLKTPFRVTNIRARRPRPGLRAQHVAALRATAELCGGRVRGADVGSDEIEFEPGGFIRGGTFEWDIGTAGSATMLALSVLPVACFADRPVMARITGGVFQDFAPSPYHLQNALLPVLSRAGVDATLRVLRPGYVPGGAGVIELVVRPVPTSLRSFGLGAQGTAGSVTGVALSSHLKDRLVSDRMASTCEQELARAGLTASIRREYEDSATQPGAVLAIWVTTSTGCILGADLAGAPGRTSERIGRTVARDLTEDLSSAATVDRHLADQAVIFVALASGTSTYLVPRVTEHFETNLWLAGRIGAGVKLRGKEVTVEGIGLSRVMHSRG